jgi:hypothetical protein
LKRYPSSRKALSVTSIVAPVSARTAGLRPGHADHPLQGTLGVMAFTLVTCLLGTLS